VAAALAAAAACSDAAGVDVRVKWPNDLHVDGSKVGGVIGETEAGAVVLGIGINASVPPELLPDAPYYRTASLQAPGRPLDADALLAACLSELAERVDAVERDGMAALLPEWRERSLELGRAVVVERAGEVIRGRVCDIGREGALIIDTGAGSVGIAPHGEVKVVVGAPAAEEQDCP
jgi:BirA family biotin operon repressor/biotin-[acetyl-CoA-carboxylase] ligase